jgi:intein/homing endonuclease
MDNKEVKNISPKDLDEQIAELNVQKMLLLDEALHSKDPNAIFKAQGYLEEQRSKSQQGAMRAFMFDPNNANFNGQGYSSVNKKVSFDILKRIGETHIAKMVKKTRIDQVKNFLKFSLDENKEGYMIRKKQSLFEKRTAPKKEEKEKIEYIVNFIENSRQPTKKDKVNGKIFFDESKWDIFDDLDEFVSLILDDSLTYDQLAFEIQRTRRFELYSYKAIDASTIRILDTIDPRRDVDNKTKYDEVNGFLPRYAQVWDSMIQRNSKTNEPIVYYPWELGFAVRNKSTDIFKNGYGTSELETLISIITWILNGFDYNGNFFKNGSNPKGFINIKSGGGQDVVNEFRDMWRTMIAGTANCLSGDTFIITRGGRKELQDFFIENDEDKYTEIWTGKKFEKGLVYKSGEKVLNKITLNNGMTIKSSPNHKFKTVNEDGDIVWKLRSELKEGDFLMVNKSSINENKDVLYYNNVEVESDLFEVIGWMIGDGWFGENKPKKRKCALFYHHSVERNLQFHHSYILDKYGINSLVEENPYTYEEKVRSKERNGFKSIADTKLRTDIIDANFYNFLNSLGFSSSKEGKNIPEFLFSCNSKYRRAFLRGFFSADCHVAGGRYIQMFIADDNIRQLTKELLLCEGIRCGNYEGNKRKINIGKPKDGYMLLVKDNDLFFDRIGLVQEHKQFKNNEFKYYSVKESFPVSLCKKEVSLMKNDLKLKYKETKQRLCNKKVTDDFSAVLTDKEVFTFNRFKNLYDVVKNHSYKYEIDNEVIDFHFEKIIKLEEFENKEEMYDVQIFDNENQFIANGILSHNSHKIPVFEGIDLEWQDLQQTNKDMEWNQWIEFLLIMFCAVYTIDPSELGFSFQQASQIFGQDGQKERLDHSKRKGLVPILKFVEKIISRYIVSEIYPDYEFVFTGIDLDDEEQKVKIIDSALKAGITSFEKQFEAYEGEKYDPKKHTILNQVFQQAQQMKQMGGDESNMAVDQMTGEADEEENNNPFAQFERGYESNPITKACINKLNTMFDGDK